MDTGSLVKALEHLVACHKPDANGQIGAQEERAAAIRAAEELLMKSKPAYTSGHCENLKSPGGCQAHNLHCGYPKCDRRPA